LRTQLTNHVSQGKHIFCQLTELLAGTDWIYNWPYNAIYQLFEGRRQFLKEQHYKFTTQHFHFR